MSIWDCPACCGDDDTCPCAASQGHTRPHEKRSRNSAQSVTSADELAPVTAPRTDKQPADSRISQKGSSMPEEVQP